jgi:hypothetical protein
VTPCLFILADGSYGTVARPYTPDWLTMFARGGAAPGRPSPDHLACMSREAGVNHRTLLVAQVRLVAISDRNDGKLYVQGLRRSFLPLRACAKESGLRQQLEPLHVELS